MIGLVLNDAMSELHQLTKENHADGFASVLKAMEMVCPPNIVTCPLPTHNF